jgi:hypothetical protein
MSGSNERGFAIVLAMFMTLLVSAIAASMTFVARTEVESTFSYTTMAQTRYAAESGVAAAADYLLSATYAGVAPGTATDALANYTITGSPVIRAGGGGAVVLSTVADQSNYPAADVVTAFGNRASGTLDVGGGTVTYGARARLLAMRQLTDSITGAPVVLQSWEITGVGRRGEGVSSAEVEVTAVIERHGVPVYRYAAFAADSGCSALRFAGGAVTGSFNSATATAGTAPTVANDSGHVGTNGNLNIEGNPTIINGTLSTPRSGFGPCSGGNVTAGVLRAEDQVTGGLVQLPQIVEYPTPPPPSPMPPTTTISLSGNNTCPAGMSDGGACVADGSSVTLTPSGSAPYVLPNVALSGHTKLVLNSGTYVVNSLIASGANVRLQVAPGADVIIHVAGEGQTQPISLQGNTISNPSYRPEALQFIYGGTGEVLLSGNSEAAALVYAPLAYVEITGGGTWYGAVVGGTVNVSGGGQIYFDTNLSKTAQTSSNPVMSAFTWRTL